MKARRAAKEFSKNENGPAIANDIERSCHGTDLAVAHADAAGDYGVLYTEINHAVLEDTVLVHQHGVFKDPNALVDYASTTTTRHMGALTKVATSELHLVRGVSIPAPAREALHAKDVPGVFGEFLFRYVKEDY